MSTTEHPTAPAGSDLPAEHGHLPQPHVVAGEGVEHEPEDPGTLGKVLRAGGLVAALVALAVFVSPWLLVVIFALVVSIFLHELGHYWTAKRSGMKVTEFFLFFGPRIWSFTRGETEYGIKLIPLGAYVKIVGMSNLEDVAPADEARTFRQKAYGPRMAVVLAGVTVNLLLGLGLIYAFLVLQGPSDDERWQIGELSTTETVERYDQSVPENAALTATFARGESPAELAGLATGDTIVRVDGQEVSTFDEAAEVILELPGEEVALTVERDGETFEATTTLGTLSDGTNARGFLGFSAEHPAQAYGVVEAVPESFRTFGEVIGQSVVGFARVFTPDGIAGVFDNATSTGDEAPAADEPAPLPGTPVEDPNADRVISIVGATYLGADLAEQGGVASLLFFIAYINIFLGIVNLVPLLPFDGGHAAVATYEKARELQLRQRRYLADVSKLLPLTYGVLLILSTLAVLTIVPDITNPPQL
jgi:membrane-associated protease RseP (regulator of RpoE activity)